MRNGKRGRARESTCPSPPRAATLLTIMKRILFFLLLRCYKNKQAWSRGGQLHILVPKYLTLPDRRPSPQRDSWEAGLIEHRCLQKYGRVALPASSGQVQLRAPVRIFIHSTATFMGPFYSCHPQKEGSIFLLLQMGKLRLRKDM